MELDPKHATAHMHLGVILHMEVKYELKTFHYPLHTRTFMLKTKQRMAEALLKKENTRARAV